VIVASIQSVYKRACELDAFDLVLVDEAHMIPDEGDGMYRQFLADARTVNPLLRVVGFTATPFRLKSGPICTPEGILNEVCFEVGVRELIRDGYLCPMVSKAGRAKVDTGALHVRGGEFIADEVEELMDQDVLVKAACAEVIEQTQERHSVLLFASGIKHGQHIVQVLKEQHAIECGFVTGTTLPVERETLLEEFSRGRMKYLCNVNVLTTGFDASIIDCVALLRPTLSPGLYYQMVGRGFRLHPGKEDCLVLDFGGNVQRHGPVDLVGAGPPAGAGNGPAPVKERPGCQALVAAGYARCPHCGHEFPPPQRQKHDATASEANVLSGQVTTTQYAVRDVRYSVHKKRGAGDDAPRTMRVDYKVGLNDFKSEWVCFEHTGFARQRAVVWWRQRSAEAVPDTAELAVLVADNCGVAVPTAITVRSVEGESFERIIRWELGPVPESYSDGAAVDFDPDEIPF
jgi:DNA repair protein RadD